MYYKHVKIVNDNSRVVNKGSFKLIDDGRVVIYNRNRFIIQATDPFIHVRDSGSVNRCSITLYDLSIMVCEAENRH